jgi:Spy/CpxP family protein refolding chaperone
MRKYTTLLLLTLTMLSALAQRPPSSRKGFDVNKFKEEKATYIKTEVGLTEEEAHRFIPLMNELMDKKFELNRSTRISTKHIELSNPNADSDYNKLIEANFDMRGKELQLEKEYYAKFKTILSSEKIYRYQRAESKFMRRMVGGKRDHIHKK